MTEKKFLIAVDLQNDFVTGSLGTREAQTIIPAAAERIRTCRAQGVTVLATMDTHAENYLSTAEGRKLPIPHCIRSSWGWQLADEVAQALGDAERVEKPTFGSLKLVDRVRELSEGAEALSIEVLGLCTDICVVSNALILKAAFPEAELSVNEACCAGVTPEKHEAALQTMESCQITRI